MANETHSMSDRRTDPALHREVALRYDQGPTETRRFSGEPVVDLALILPANLALVLMES